jgi:hypothetical protein
MNTLIEARIARVAKNRGCSFSEAARLVSLAALRRRNARKREEERLTRLRSTWAWRRDFE